MKRRVSVLAVALLLAGCGGEDASKENGNGSEINLDDPATRRMIIAEAIDSQKLAGRATVKDDKRVSD